MTNLKKPAKLFGLTFFGDGATVKKMPLVNIIASGVQKPAGVLDTVDCSKRCAEGLKKDAPYISNLFLPYFEHIDPRKEFIDLVYFDGASNVQKVSLFVVFVF